MISELRESVGFSFKELEQGLWHQMIKEFSRRLSIIVETIDEKLLKQRDRARFRMKDMVERSMITMFGEGVSFKRRRYHDCETGRDVYLLDKVLGLEPNGQISPTLFDTLLTQAAVTSSYRKAAEACTRLLGFQAVSHETIRQAVLEAGLTLEEITAKRCEDPQGQRKVPVLFLETDGMMVSLQRDKRRNLEEKVMTTHEGWEPRYKGSKEWRLKKVDQFRSQNGPEFWEQASRYVYTRYDIDADTLVVINGDRASWIRQGIGYFPNAIYQVDRFHLVRDINRIFSDAPEDAKAIIEALDRDATGHEFLGACSAAYHRLTDTKAREDAKKLINDVIDTPEIVVDYRVRMKHMGLPTDGLRGLGAAESQIDRFSDRMKGRGQSWSPKGASAMMELQSARNTGRLEKIIDRIEAWGAYTQEKVTLATDVIKQAVRSAMAKDAPRLDAGVPIKSAGTKASGGLSRLFSALEQSGMPALG